LIAAAPELLAAALLPQRSLSIWSSVSHVRLSGASIRINLFPISGDSVLQEVNLMTEYSPFDSIDVPNGRDDARCAHAPGPWQLANGAIVYNDGRGPNAMRIATVQQRGKPQAANARLIAAAPELLEALQLAVPLLVRLGRLYRK
jgi:hypothetical protein